MDGKLGETKNLKRVKDKVVLIQRGVLTFQDKINNAKKAGAKAVIIFNNTKGSFTAGVEEEIDVPAATIPKKEGEQIRNMLSRKQSKTVTFVYRKEARSVS